MLITGVCPGNASADDRYGHGVYFAHDAETSMGSYARGSSVQRPNADFPVIKATALVELGGIRLNPSKLTIVNVPNAFASSNPYYVGEL